MSRIKQLFFNQRNSLKEFFSNKENKISLISLISTLSAITICVLVATICAHNYPDYVYIDSEEDLEKMRDNLDGDYIISKQNIEITKPWTPIGTTETPFTGTIQGNGCTISFANSSYNFVENDSNIYFGFFGSNEGTIRNLKFYIHSMNFESNSDKNFVFGCVAAFNNGSISSCEIIQATNNVSISSNGDIYAGGICGIGSHNFSKSRSSIKLSLSSNKGIFAGGVVGYANNDLDMWETSSLAELKVTYSLYDSTLGGLVGIAKNGLTCQITNCLSKCSFYATDSTSGLFGGVVGKSLVPNFDIKNIFSSCNITNYQHINSSNFVCDGIYSITNSISNPNFINCKEEYLFGSFAYKEMENTTFENCYYTKHFEYAFDNYGTFMNIVDISLGTMKWDNKIWGRNEDGSFKLL